MFSPRAAFALLLVATLTAPLAASALTLPTAAPPAAPLFQESPLRTALAAELAACPTAACKSAAAEGFAEAVAARLMALPTGRAGVLAVTEEALSSAGYPAAAAAPAVSPTLEAALLRFYAALDAKVDAAEVARQSAAVPTGLSAPLAALVDAVADAHVASARILAPEDAALLAADPALTLKLVTFVGSAPPGTASPQAEALWARHAAALARADRGAIAEASRTLAAAISAFTYTGATAACERVLDLPFVQVGGACDDTYTAMNALQVDLGGNDRYLNGAGAGLSSGVGAGASLDLGEGNDTYFAVSSAQGFGLAGVGILYDEGGSDSYNVSQFGQGFATAGFGLAYDAGSGDDNRTSGNALDSIGTKGGALAGIGILVDEGGNDYYQQDGLDGFVYGAAGGHGWLLERGDGNDFYLSRDMPITLLGEFLGSFTGPIQISSEVSGTSILLEAGGDDRYRCGDHVRQGCQGASGADSLTLLLEQGGNDTYAMGVSISEELVPGLVIFSMGQGSAYGPSAPGGIAVLRDEAGNDAYLAEKWAQGFGTVGAGFLLDAAGRDAYSIRAAAVGERLDRATWVDGFAGFGRDEA